MQSTDISNALDKAIEYLDNTEQEEPHVKITYGNPFALRMRMYRFMKAYRIQMKDNEVVDENKYNHLNVQAVADGVVITSSIEQEPLTMVTESGEEL